MGAFEQTWNILKDEEQPDDDFHRLNDPNPTIAFGASLRNNPAIAEMMQQQQEAYNTPYSEGGVMHECQHCSKKTDTSWDDIYSDQFCSKRCEEGLNPTCQQLTDEKCEYVLTQQPQYNREISDYHDAPHHSIEIQCPKCHHQMYGEVS